MLGIHSVKRVQWPDHTIGELALLRMAVGQTDELDGGFAAQEILKQCTDALGGQEPQAGLLLAAHDLDFEEFLSVVTAVYPGMDLIGCTTMAPMSSVASFVEGSTTLTLFASDVLEFSAGLGTDVVADVKSATRQAVDEATRKTEKQPALLIVTPTIEEFDPNAITFEIGEVLGRTVPVLAVARHRISRSLCRGSVVSSSMAIVYSQTRSRSFSSRGRSRSQSVSLTGGVP